jgi:hypothetical protein
MDFVLERAREYLGAACDPQLRLVSRSCRDLLAAVPHEDLRIEDFRKKCKTARSTVRAGFYIIYEAFTVEQVGFFAFYND